MLSTVILVTDTGRVQEYLHEQASEEELYIKCKEVANDLGDYTSKQVSAIFQKLRDDPECDLQINKWGSTAKAATWRIETS